MDEASEKRFGNGMQIPLTEAFFLESSDSHLNDEEKGRFKFSAVDGRNALIRVYGSSGDFLALGMIIDNGKGKYLKARKFF